jgi:hypothetical protein
MTIIYLPGDQSTPDCWINLVTVREVVRFSDGIKLFFNDGSMRFFTGDAAKKLLTKLTELSQ